MEAEDWALLDIEPTTELAAIKKAYAIKLKTTRPDDDAQAYQALRGAYERAQQWVRWQAHASPETAQDRAEPVAAGHDGDDTMAAAASMPAAAVDAPHEAALRPSFVPPQVLIEALELAWRRNGTPGLADAWLEAQATLQAQPLASRPLHSVTFARWLVNLPQLPSDFVMQLEAEFGWRADYRAHQTLGAELAEALEEALEARQPRELGDPELRHRARPLLALQERLRAGHMASTLGLLFLLHPALLRELAALGPALLRRLGLDVHDQLVLNTWLGRAGLMRLTLVIATFWAAGLAVGASWVPNTARTLTWGVSSGFALGAAYVLGLALSTPPGRLGRWVRAWGQVRPQPGLGLGLLGTAAFLAYFDRAGSELLRAPMLAASPGNLDGLMAVCLAALGLAGLLGAWPRHPERGITCVGLIALTWGIVTSTAPATGPTSAALWGCSAWVLLGAAVTEGRLPLPAPVIWLLRPVQNSLILCQRWGPMFSLLPAVAALGYALLPGLPVRASGLFLVWVLSLLTLAAAQSRAEAWAQKRLSA